MENSHFTLMVHLKISINNYLSKMIIFLKKHAEDQIKCYIEQYIWMLSIAK